MENKELLAHIMAIEYLLCKIFSIKDENMNELVKYFREEIDKNLNEEKCKLD